MSELSGAERRETVVRWIEDARDMGLTGAMSFDGLLAGIYFDTGQPRHAFLRRDAGMAEGDAALLHIVVTLLGRPGKLTWRSLEVIPKTTIGWSADELADLVVDAHTAPAVTAVRAEPSATQVPVADAFVPMLPEAPPLAPAVPERVPTVFAWDPDSARIPPPPDPALAQPDAPLETFVVPAAAAPPPLELPVEPVRMAAPVPPPTLPVDVPETAAPAPVFSWEPPAVAVPERGSLITELTGAAAVAEPAVAITTPDLGRTDVVAAAEVLAAVTGGRRAGIPMDDLAAHSVWSRDWYSDLPVADSPHDPLDEAWSKGGALAGEPREEATPVRTRSDPWAEEVETEGSAADFAVALGTMSQRMARAGAAPGEAVTDVNAVPWTHVDVARLLIFAPLLALVPGVGGHLGHSAPVPLLVFLDLAILAATAAMLVFTVVRGRGAALSTLGIRGANAEWYLWAIVVGLGGAALAYVLGATQARFIPGATSACDPKRTYDHALVLAGVVAGVLAPPVREVFFRGFIYGYLRSVLSTAAAVAACAALVGVVQLVGGGVVTVLPAAIFAAASALVYERSGSVVPGMIAGAIYGLYTLGAAC